ncbi:uncharacterized protein [Nothobranchius furzeri]|uniref:uncharacterized protein isoform X1 n=1 Tax=Nothobranchius furzeri TaxID=105023 RepID=UPI003904C597
MAFKSTSKLLELTQRSWSWQKSFCSLGYSGSFTVEHDRLNRCFTVSPVSSGEGVNSIPDFKPGSRIDSSAARQQAVLYYRFTGDKQVDLMSTFVPETFRGQRIAALLSQIVEGRRPHDWKGRRSQDWKGRRPLEWRGRLLEWRGRLPDTRRRRLLDTRRR